MSKNALENYLQKMDKTLAGISVSERAEIITEIKSHVLDAQQREPEKSIEEILTSLGEADTVANKYLLERGLKPVKPGRSPIIKWLVIGFLGTFGMILLFVLILIWRFTPLVAVDEEKGSVRLLGGAISISDQDVKVHRNGFSIDIDELIEDSPKQVIEGIRKFEGKKIKPLNIDFVNGEFELSSVVGNELKWSCSAIGAVNPEANENKEAVDLEFKNAKCTISVPENIAVNLDGKNGKISFNEIKNPLKLRLKNGAVNLRTVKNKKYNFSITGKKVIVNKTVASSQDKGAYLVDLEMENGLINIE